MDTLHFLRDLLIVFAVAGVVVFLFHRIRVPSVVGLLVAGVLTGPYGFGWIQETERVHTLAEIGVVVLLFAVGLEFSIPRLVGMGRLMARIGLPQVLFCILVGFILTYSFSGAVRPAIFAGMLLAMSSTAVVFKLLTDRGEMASPHGNVSAAVLLFQDLLVVGCMVVLPLLAAKDDNDVSLWRSLGLGTVVVVMLLLVGRYVVPTVLFQVVQTKNRELFLMMILLLCLGSAAITAGMGWSLALGAFIAGLALSESQYATQTLAEVLPFRDTLSSLFFVSVGMLLDLGFVIHHVPLVLGMVLLVIVLKFIASGLPTLLAGYPLRIAVLSGVTLAQIGEFSFILADRGLDLKLLDQVYYQAFLATAVLTITLTPLLIALGPRLAQLIMKLPLPEHWRVGQGGVELNSERVSARGHVVIVGYGLNGRNLARVLRAADVEYVILELNPETVRRAREQDEPVYYGDGSRPAVLEHLGTRLARVLVIAMSDAASSRRIVQLARALNPNLHIIVRTRYLTEVTRLRQLGANTIIPEEFETSIEIFSRVLTEYEVPRNITLDLIERVRSDHYEVLRDANTPSMRMVLPHSNILAQMEIESCFIRDDSPVLGHKVGELKLRTVTGATLLAVRRNQQLFLNPGAEFSFEAKDTAILVGSHDQVTQAMSMIDPKLTEGRVDNSKR